MWTVLWERATFSILLCMHIFFPYCFVDYSHCYTCFYTTKGISSLHTYLLCICMLNDSMYLYQSMMWKQGASLVAAASLWSFSNSNIACSLSSLFLTRLNFLLSISLQHTDTHSACLTNGRKDWGQEDDENAQIYWNILNAI